MFIDLPINYIVGESDCKIHPFVVGNKLSPTVSIKFCNANKKLFKSYNSAALSFFLKICNEPDIRYEYKWPHPDGMQTYIMDVSGQIMDSTTLGPANKILMTYKFFKKLLSTLTDDERISISSKLLQTGLMFNYNMYDCFLLNGVENLEFAIVSYNKNYIQCGATLYNDGYENYDLIYHPNWKSFFRVMVPETSPLVIADNNIQFCWNIFKELGKF